MTPRPETNNFTEAPYLGRAKPPLAFFELCSERTARCTYISLPTTAAADLLTSRQRPRADKPYLRGLTDIGVRVRHILAPNDTACE